MPRSSTADVADRDRDRSASPRGIRAERDQEGERSSDHDENGNDKENEDDDDDGDDGDDDEDDEDDDNDGTDEDGDDDEEEEEEPPYTARDITNVIKEFYEFLTTLHFCADDLLVPPLSGWQHLPEPDIASVNKSPLVLEVLKHLPYFQAATPAQVHYKSRVRVFSNFTLDDHDPDGWDDYFMECLEGTYEDEVTVEDILVIAEGRESGGRAIALIPKKGEVFEDMLRCGISSPHDIFDYFDGLKDKYRQLKLIGGVGKNVVEADRVPEAEGEITMQMLQQQDPNPPTGFNSDLNVQYLRQIHRKHGWPENFRREEAMIEVEHWMKPFEAEGRDTWEDDMTA